MSSPEVILTLSITPALTQRSQMRQTMRSRTKACFGWLRHQVHNRQCLNAVTTSRFIGMSFLERSICVKMVKADCCVAAGFMTNMFDMLGHLSRQFICATRASIGLGIWAKPRMHNMSRGLKICVTVSGWHGRWCKPHETSLKRDVALRRCARWLTLGCPCHCGVCPCWFKLNWCGWDLFSHFLRSAPSRTVVNFTPNSNALRLKLPTEFYMHEHNLVVCTSASLPHGCICWFDSKLQEPCASDPTVSGTCKQIDSCRY